MTYSVYTLTCECGQAITTRRKPRRPMSAYFCVACCGPAQFSNRELARARLAGPVEVNDETTGAPQFNPVPWLINPLRRRLV